jgi:large subunit ribosomal protein L18
MITRQSGNELRKKRHRRIRLYVSGTAERPRLSVFRSAKYIYAQLIDDTNGRTLAAASSREEQLRGGGPGKVDAARAVGRAIGERARAAGIRAVVLDRGGYRYHGRVRSLAEGARESGLEL